jgi:hypothetical protein
MMNSDLITQNLFIIKEHNQDLIKELQTLIWDQKALLKGQHKEDARKDNHLTDALLYGHHASRHYWFKPKPEEVSQEEQLTQMIERQFGNMKPKGRYIKKNWMDEDIDV